MKFKVGDRAKVIKEGTHCQKIGAIVKILKVDEEEKTYYADCPYKGGWYFEEDELATAQFTKSDLKDGDIVTYRNGQKRIKIGNKLFNEGGSTTNWLHSYNEDLTRECKEYKKTDIVKVERHPEGLETVFKREEILNKAEKEYSSSVIRPFKNEIRGIVKEKFNDKNWISIDFKNDACMDFPNLDKKEDYKNMEAGKMYALEELGL